MALPSHPFRRAKRYLALAVAALLLGLTVHFAGTRLLGSAQDAIGDALWATMLGALVSAVVPRRSPWTRYLAALLICYAVEVSQLWHTPALDYLRATRLGPLVLGSGFAARDFLAYGVGIFVFAALDVWWVADR